MSKVKAVIFRFFTIVLGAGLITIALGMGCQNTSDASSPIVGNSSTDSSAELAIEEAGNPGIPGDRVLFGQSAAFSVPAQVLGNQMRLGIQAHFHQQNEAGGVCGRLLEQTTLDDSY